MTNHWIDLKNTDCALIIGANPAENHPISFRWLLKARDERGAKIISVDPRFTRSSSKADIYAYLRPGTDIAFVGGMINYILEKELFFKDYVVHYTNAAFIVDDGFDFKDGMFSGWNAQTKKYDTKTWGYKLGPDQKPLKDPTLQDPRCVFQLLKKHYSRYTVDEVCKVTGTPKEVYLQICEAYGNTGKPDKSGAILYAMGGTQHSVGSQNVRIFAMIQLLLGNIGVPGGGVNALRGESNVQGSTDMGLLNHNLPGYLNTPTNVAADYGTLEAYHKKETPKTSYWVNKPKFVNSLLKAFYGEKATKENEFGYQWLPKRDAKKNYSYMGIFDAMGQGQVKGLLCFGQNPLVGGPNTKKEHEALTKLDWLVSVDLVVTETANFWSKEAGMDPAKINTEVFILPAAMSFEKEGSITNSGRWAQWRWKCVEAPGEAKPDLWIYDQIVKRMKKLYAGSTDPKDEPILNLHWDYGDHEPDADKVAKEISGYVWDTKAQLATFGDLKDDGSTACGCWIYGGMHHPAQGNRAKNRKADTDPKGIGNNLGWAFAWPANRRIIYNRAAADMEGKPWSEDKKVIYWDPTKGDASKNEKGKWVGNDVPDFPPATDPENPAWGDPFIMRPDGKGGLMANMAEGPFPEHYEPFESPVAKNPFSAVSFNPVAKVWDTDKKGSIDKFPIVATTYRVCEHWQSGSLTRNTPWTAELMPYMFVEMSKELAQEKGIANGEECIVASARGEVKAVAIVTERLKPVTVNGEKRHTVGMPWHYGFMGYVKGNQANLLTAMVGDPNSMIPEYKAFLCDVRRK